ncbi:MAG: serine acetyltransferase [Deltaproteobacteria bacterium]|nr:serine acetyltransferase [Myxococcales bacterium]MCZ6569829.1 serine acetyltransferase [Deltaproteobacteria bacterium]MCZ6713057.1 serine acetyltransferase [Deltaproteobacteria bacterium]MCZ6821785.1 serine acetyltransferase [Deltaproteobacteria bacterium]TDI96043.1 MAG: serine acetyltransferase [Deltaproteobacteria bacterium]
MANHIQPVAQRLKEQRAKNDPVSEARKNRGQNPERVLEALEKLREVLLDQTPSEELECDLEVAHGLARGLIGPEKANHLIECLPEIRHSIAMDVEAAFHGDPAANTYAEVIAAYPSVLAVSTYRIAHPFYELDELVAARIMSENAHRRTGIDIHPGASIGRHFFIDHGTGVVIGETTVIGDRVKLYHGVTLGAFSNREGRSDKGRKRHPTLEDDVTIYPNATILGGETVIGKGAVIGGNAWLTRSVEPNTMVRVDPPQMKLRQERDDPGEDYDI